MKMTPPGQKIKLGSEPPAIPGQPWQTIWGIQSTSPCPGCGSQTYRQVWSPGRDLWLCTGPTSCGTYWSPTFQPRRPEPGEPDWPTPAELWEMAGKYPLEGPEPEGPLELPRRVRDASEALF